MFAIGVAANPRWCCSTIGAALLAPGGTHRPTRRWYRLIALDHRGWGESDAPPQGYGISDLADDAQSVISATEIKRYFIVEHSMGGKVAQLVALRRPVGLA